MRPRLLFSRPLGAGLAAGLLLSACGGSDDAGCGPILTERLDPANAVHIIGGFDVDDFLTDPPTSGPHVATDKAGGVLDQPIPRANQVGLLEVGSILIQWNGLEAADLELLESLANETDVVVAPNPDLDAPVVATAWLHSRTCLSVDGLSIEQIAEFIDQRRGHSPGEQA